jgi:hypothetical protein
MTLTLTARVDRPHIPPSGSCLKVLVEITAPAQECP